MATRKIKIIGKNPTPNDNNKGSGNNTNNNADSENNKKRKSPRCHNVRLYFRKDGTKVKEHKRPKLCIYIPQIPFVKKGNRPISTPNIPNPPKPPNLPKFPKVSFPKRLSVKQERALKDALKYIKQMKDASRGEYLILRNKVDDALRALGLVDAWGIATDFEVALKVKEIIKEGNELTLEQARDLIARAKSGNILVPVNLRGKKTFFYDDYLEIAENLIGQVGVRVDSTMRETIGKKIKIPQGMGGKTVEETEELIKQVLRQNMKNKEQYKKALDQLVKQNQKVLEQGQKEISRYVDEVAQTYGDDFWKMISNSADDVAKGGKVVGGKLLNGIIGAAFAAVDVGLRKARGEDNFRAIGAAASSVIGSTAAGAACVATGLATGGIGLGICAGIGSIAATIAFETANDKIRNQPEGLPTPKPTNTTPTPKPTPKPNPSPTPAPKPRPAPSPTPAPAPSPSPAPTPTPKPKTLPQGIKVEGQREDGRPRYVSADGESVWVYKPGTADGGYWRGGKNKPTINPVTGKPLEKGKKKDNQSPSPSPTPKPKPTPSPTPIPRPSPSPSPKPTPSPSPSPKPSPSPSPTPKPSPTPNPAPTGDGGTIPPNVVPPPPPQNSQPSQPRSDRPTDPQFTCVIKKDGTGYWRRKKGTPKVTPKPSTPCQPI